jgi:hypothetical protein
MSGLTPLHSEYNQNKLQYLSVANNSKNISLQENVNQLNEQATKTFTLLVVWFIITLFIFVVTILTLLNESSLNPLVIIIVMLFLFYVLFYFSTNIYNMFK